MFNMHFLDGCSLGGTTLCAAPNKCYDFSTNYHACMAMPTLCRWAPPILLWPWPPFNLFPRSCLTWIFLMDVLWGVPLCVQRPTNAMTFQQSIMHVWQCLHCVDVWWAPPILLWPWPPFNLFPRSCLTWIFLMDVLWGVPLCVQRPTNAITFQQIIMHVWQYPHCVDGHLLFCFDLDLHLTCFQGHV